MARSHGNDELDILTMSCENFDIFLSSIVRFFSTKSAFFEAGRFTCIAAAGDAPPSGPDRCSLLYIFGTYDHPENWQW
jgi:hypothetical protein